MCTYIAVEGVAVKVPGGEELDASAHVLGPGVSVGQGGVHGECGDAEGSKEGNECSADLRPTFQAKCGNAVERKVDNLAEGHDGKIECGQVVMQEQLASHQKEGKVVERPAQDRGAQLIVESLEDDIAVVVEAPLPAQNGKRLERSVDQDRQCGGIPDGRIAKEVNLTMVFAPEVDATTQRRPRRRPRVPSV